MRTIIHKKICEIMQASRKQFTIRPDHIIHKATVTIVELIKKAIDQNQAIMFDLDDLEPRDAIIIDQVFRVVTEVLRIDPRKYISFKAHDCPSLIDWIVNAIDDELKNR